VRTVKPFPVGRESLLKREKKFLCSEKGTVEGAFIPRTEEKLMPKESSRKKKGKTESGAKRRASGFLGKEITGTGWGVNDLVSSF